MKEAITLSTLTHAVKEILYANFESTLLIKAEVASISHSQRGHVYFDLIEKDGNTIIARVKGNMWRSYAYGNLSYFEQVNHRPIQSGDELMMHVQVSYNPVYGLSLSIEKIEAEYTLGQRELQKQKVYEKIVKEGLIERNKQLSTPTVITTIAVISAEGAAGYQDFLVHLKQNTQGYHFSTHLFQSLMQGDQASYEITKAFAQLAVHQHLFDVVVLIRGGGAGLDLDCFSEYKVCQTIANCPIPVITGLGHERDVSLADKCAHLSLKTPTAVAGFLIQHNIQVENRLSNIYEDIKVATLQTLENSRSVLKNLLLGINQSTQQRNIAEKNKLVQFEYRIKSGLKTLLDNSKNNLAHILAHLHSSTTTTIHNKRFQLKTLNKSLIDDVYSFSRYQNVFLENCEKQIALANPDRILKRGFAYIKKENKIITKGFSLKKGDAITIHFNDKKTNAEIK